MNARNTVTRNRRRGASGFTLIELLLVMMIIAILAAVVVPQYSRRTEQARVSAAQHEVATIKGQLQVFELDNSRYPTSEEGLTVLVTNPGNLPGWKHYYLDKLPSDSWGHSYVYHNPGGLSKDFDLYSLGPSGQDGAADNIGDTNRS